MLKRRSSFQKSLCPVVMCPYLCSSEVMFQCLQLPFKVHDQFSKAQSRKLGLAPGRFELSKGMLNVEVWTSSGSGIRDSQFEMLRIEIMRTDRVPYRFPQGMGLHDVSNATCLAHLSNDLSLTTWCACRGLFCCTHRRLCVWFAHRYHLLHAM